LSKPIFFRRFITRNLNFHAISGRRYV
jgi:hypothetical protein